MSTSDIEVELDLEEGGSNTKKDKKGKGGKETTEDIHLGNVLAEDADDAARKLAAMGVTGRVTAKETTPLSNIPDINKTIATTLQALLSGRDLSAEEKKVMINQLDNIEAKSKVALRELVPDSVSRRSELISSPIFGKNALTGKDRTAFIKLVQNRIFKGGNQDRSHLRNVLKKAKSFIEEYALNGEQLYELLSLGFADEALSTLQRYEDLNKPPETLFMTLQSKYQILRPSTDQLEAKIYKLKSTPPETNAVSQTCDALEKCFNEYYGHLTQDERISCCKSAMVEAVYSIASKFFPFVLTPLENEERQLHRQAVIEGNERSYNKADTLVSLLVKNTRNIQAQGYRPEQKRRDDGDRPRQGQNKPKRGNVNAADGYVYTADDVRPAQPPRAEGQPKQRFQGEQNRFDNRPRQDDRGAQGGQGQGLGQGLRRPQGDCFFCRKPNHFWQSCFLLISRFDRNDAEAVAFVKKRGTDAHKLFNRKGMRAPGQGGQGQGGQRDHGHVNAAEPKAVLRRERDSNDHGDRE
jgi:hypothetical protein